MHWDCFDFIEKFLNDHVAISQFCCNRYTRDRLHLTHTSMRNVNSNKSGEAKEKNNSDGINLDVLFFSWLQLLCDKLACIHAHVVRYVCLRTIFQYIDSLNFSLLVISLFNIRMRSVKHEFACSRSSYKSSSHKFFG